MTEGVGARKPSVHSKRLARAASLGLAVLLLASLGARLWYSSIHELSYDETHNLMIALLANQGYATYSEIYAVIMPFAVTTMRISAALWDTAHTVRLLMIGYGLMGIAALYFLVYRHSRSKPVLAAVFAATFFSFNPHFFFVSTSINLEAGAIAWGLLAVALVELYRTSSAKWRMLWILLSGIAFGLSLTMKVFVPFIPAVVGLQLVLVQVSERSDSLRAFKTYWMLAKQVLLWSLGSAAVAAVFLLLFDSAALVEQVLASRFALREAIETDTQGVNISEALTGADLYQYVPLLFASILGVYAIWRQRLAQAWTWLAWLLLALAFLLSHDPVRPRHTVMIVPSLAALSGIGLGFALERMEAKWSVTTRWLNPLLAAGLIILAFVSPLPYMENRTFVETHPVRQAAIDYIVATTAPDECVISKENRLIIQADRLTAPWLSLISTARLFSDLLPAHDIAAEASLHNCPVLVYSDTFDQLVPNLRNELDERYALRLTMVHPAESDYRLDVYSTLMDSNRIPDKQTDYRLGDEFLLTGYSITEGPWRPGETVYLSTFWQALDSGVDSGDGQTPRVQHDYKLFVHLLNEQASAVGIYDHYPFSIHPTTTVDSIDLNEAYLVNGRALPADYPRTGMIPTRLWVPGETLVETIAIQLPEELENGDYTIMLGMYDEASMQRLPVAENGVESDHVLLEPLRVQRP